MYQIKKTTNLLLLFTLISFAGVASAAPLGNSFTYQGRLIDADQAADGLYDFQFKLFDAVSGGDKLGSDVNKADVDVIDGYFTVELDFGNVFDGSARWLEIGVRPGDQNDPNVYTTLDPRQKITPVPYALKARGVTGMDANNTYLGAGVGIYSGGSNNTFAGYQAGYSNTGINNTFLGYLAGRSNNANYNIFIGDSAGYSNTSGYCNTFLGHAAGYKNIGGGNNTFMGYLAGYSGMGSGNNTFIGHRAGLNTTYIDNTFIGNQAGQNNTSGYNNTFLGSTAGYDSNTGYDNTFLGYSAGNKCGTGSQNTFVGYAAGHENTSGSGNVFIGCGAGYSETGSNKLYVANGSSDSSILIYGDFSTRCVGIGTKTPARSLHVSDVIRLQPRSSAPSSPAEGDIYMDSSTHKLMVYADGSWHACW